MWKNTSEKYEGRRNRLKNGGLSGAMDLDPELYLKISTKIDNLIVEIWAECYNKSRNCRLAG